MRRGERTFCCRTTLVHYPNNRAPRAFIKKRTERATGQRAEPTTGKIAMHVSGLRPAGDFARARSCKLHKRRKDHSECIIMNLTPVLSWCDVNADGSAKKSSPKRRTAESKSVKSAHT